MGVAQSTMRDVGVDDEAAAEAAADVAAALAAVGQAVRASLLHTNLQKQTLLETLELADDAEVNANELKEQLAAAEAFADGEAGDRVKYVAAGRSMLKRWRLCLAIYNMDEAEAPTEAMAKSFTVFLFKMRQKRSVHGREGLGDSMGEMAQYTLAQVVFPMMGYKDWQGLSSTELRVKAAPFCVIIREEWVRLRRAFPEMQSAAMV